MLKQRDRWPHRHGDKTHMHAWSSLEHSHTQRELCQRDECEGCEKHNVHPEPASLHVVV